MRTWGCRSLAARTLLLGFVACLFTPVVAAQDAPELLLRVELVLESRDPSIDTRAAMNAAEEAQREARGFAQTVLHVVVPVGGDAEVHVHALTDDGPDVIESFIIPRGGPHWLTDALVEQITRRLVRVRAPVSSLLFSWDGTRSIQSRPGLVEWHVLRVEGATHLSTPPRR